VHDNEKARLAIIGQARFFCANGGASAS